MIYLNSAGLKELSNMEYVMFTILSGDKKLGLLPCDENTRDAIPVRSGGKSKKRPRYIRCRAGIAEKILNLMQWEKDCRYRVRGLEATCDNKKILSFNLATAEAIYAKQK
jgi:hypothetical protein